jgi:competence protein ComEC
MMTNRKHICLTVKFRAIALALLAVMAVLLLSSCGLAQDGADGTGPTGEARGFTVYFIDVGQADSALVLCDGRSMLIDGGNVADSDLIYAFLKNHDVTRLDYIVATHGHEDHCGGLAGALNYATAGIALSPVTKFDSRAFGNFVKYLGEQGVSITVPEPGYTFELGGASVEVVGPITESAEPNNTSIVLRVVYGDTSFLFTGDAERAEEADILETGFDLRSTVLKVGHHGGDTSTTYPFLREVMPEYAVISVGANNSYGHPHENTLSRLRDAEAMVYRTDLQSTITCVSDGKTVSFQTETSNAVPTNPT